MEYVTRFVTTSGRMYTHDFETDEVESMRELAREQGATFNSDKEMLIEATHLILQEGGSMEVDCVMGIPGLYTPAKVHMATTAVEFFYVEELK